MKVMTWATARSTSSGRPRAASHGMSREASHCCADACSTSSPTSSAQSAVAVAERPAVAGRARLGDRAERREAGARIGVRRRRRARRASRRCAARRRRAAAARSARGGSGPASTRAPAPRRTSHAPRAAGALASPTDVVPATRAQPGSSSATARDGVLISSARAGRHALDRRREQHLETAAELELLGVDPVRPTAHGPAALRLHRRGQRRVALAIARQPAADALELHRRPQRRVVEVHRQQRLRSTAPPSSSSKRRAR